MPESKDITCALCQSEIPPGFTVCPKCGTRIGEVLSARPVGRGPPQILMGSAISSDLPAAALPEMKSSCPSCAAPLGSQEKKCARCGTPLSPEAATVECPECGAIELVGSGSCTRCGASLTKKVEWTPKPAPPPQPPVIESAPRPPPIAPAPAPVPKPEPEIVPPAAPVPEEIRPDSVQSAKTETTAVSKTTQAPQGLTNGRGVINGTYRGTVNGTYKGAVNGVGMINGRGAVNGTGLVNGAGLTNGSAVSGNPRPRSSDRDRVEVRWKLLVLVVVAVVLIPTLVFLFYPDNETAAIDGNFDDWDDAPKFGMKTIASLPELAVYEWALKPFGTSVSVFLRVQGAVMGSSQVDSFYLFVDTDGSDVTGYSISGMGAEYALEIDGWDGRVQSGTLLAFVPGEDRLDWNSWTRTGPLSWGAKAGMIEAKASLGTILDENARYLLLSQNNVENPAYSISYPVPASGGILIVRAVPGSSVSSIGTIPISPGETLARLELTCQGRSGSVSSIVPTIMGAELRSPVRDISLSPGQTLYRDVQVDTSASQTTDPVYMLLADYDITSSFKHVVIETESVCAYASTPPSTVEIDGAFGDWIGRTSSDTDVNPVPNPNVDLSEVGAANSTVTAYFYVAVEGQICQGTYAPSIRSRPSTMGGGGTVIETRQSGEDLMRILIDSDHSNTSGQVVSYPTKTIGADHMIEIKGADGEITSQDILEFVDGEWVEVSMSVSIEKDLQRMELSVPLGLIGSNRSFNCVIETTDWRGGTDWSVPPGLQDPWVMDAAGNTYVTMDGRTWTYIGKPSLEPGDYIVDIALSTDSTKVYTVTNTGRTFSWVIGTSSSWEVGQTIPIDTLAYGEAVSMSFYGKTAAWLLTRNGAYFWLMNVGNPVKPWTYQDMVTTGVIDFTDLVYAGGTMYALRSWVNSPLHYSNNGNSFISTTSPTGSSSFHAEFTYIPNGPGSADDRLFVLCMNGDIRYSANGGVTWSSLGNLPIPTGGNTTKYTGLGIDPAGYMWVVTDSGYAYRSTDTTTYSSFAYVGRAPITGIVAVVPLPIIPEFSDLVLPLVFSVVTVAVLRRSSRGRVD